MPYKDKSKRKKYSAAWYQRNRKRMIGLMKVYSQSPAGKESKWRSGLKYKFGITHLDYHQMWQKQKGLCALCGLALPKRTHAQVDHDHNTEEIRGLVHLRCNLVIGVFEKWGALVAVYLRKPR